MLKTTNGAELKITGIGGENSLEVKRGEQTWTARISLKNVERGVIYLGSDKHTPRRRDKKLFFDAREIARMINSHLSADLAMLLVGKPFRDFMREYIPSAMADAA